MDVDPSSDAGAIYREYGLSSGTYFYKIVDSFQQVYILSVYVPLSVTSILPLRVVQYDDYSVHVEWDEFLSTYSDVPNETASIYLNDTLVERNIEENNYTLTNLKPNTRYRIYIVSAGGWKSNTIGITTSNEQASLLSKLDDMLRKLLIPDNNIDSDNDGISDSFDKLVDAIKNLNNYAPIQIGQSTAGQIGNWQSNFPAGPVLGDPNASMGEIIDSLNDDTLNDAFNDFKLEVEFAPGLKFNVFDLNRYKTIIAVIRGVLVAFLYIELFIFFMKVLIPVFKL